MTPRFQPMFTSDRSFTPTDASEEEPYEPVGGLQLEEEESEPIIAGPSKADLLDELKQLKDISAQQAEDLRAYKEREALIVSAVSELAIARKMAIQTAATEVGELVIALTERIVGHSLALHPTSLQELLERALSTIPEEDEVWITVPEGRGDQAQIALGDLRKAHISEDPEVFAGCKITTKTASVEATLSAALEAVETAVNQWLNSDPIIER